MHPVLGGGRLQAYVVAPAKPGIAAENVMDLIKGSDGFISLTGMRVIYAQVNQRIGFSLEHMMLTANPQSFLIMFQRALEVMQLAMNPPNAIGHARIPKQVAIATGH